MDDIEHALAVVRHIERGTLDGLLCLALTNHINGDDEQAAMLLSCAIDIAVKSLSDDLQTIEAFLKCPPVADVQSGIGRIKVAAARSHSVVEILTAAVAGCGVEPKSLRRTLAGLLPDEEGRGSEQL